jgi:hypothetical protein
MTKGHHLNYLNFNLIKVERCQNIVNHHEQGGDNIFSMMRWIILKFGSSFRNFGALGN